MVGHSVVGDDDPLERSTSTLLRIPLSNLASCSASQTIGCGWKVGVTFSMFSATRLPRKNKYCTVRGVLEKPKWRPLELTLGNGEPGNIFESFCRLGGFLGVTPRPALLNSDKHFPSRVRWKQEREFEWHQNEFALRGGQEEMAGRLDRYETVKMHS